MEIISEDTSDKMKQYASKCIKYIIEYDKNKIYHNFSQICGHILMRPHPDNTYHYYDFYKLLELIKSIYNDGIALFNLITVRSYEIILLAHLIKVLDLNIYYDHDNNGKLRKGILRYNIGEYGFNNKYNLNIWTREHDSRFYT